MGDTRPDFDEFYQMALSIRDDIGDARALVCPVDHGAYADSLFIRSPMRAAGVNAIFYERGPYTMWPWIKEMLEDVWFERVLGQNLEREDCIEQNTTKVFGEYRRILTSAEEVGRFVDRIGGIDVFVGFDDWADSGISALGIYVFGLLNHSRFEVPLENVRLAASSDSTGGLAHYAARRSVPRIFPTPERYIEEMRPKTFGYLMKKGIIRPDYRDIGISVPADADKSVYRPSAPDLVLLNRLVRTGAHDDSGT